MENIGRKQDRYGEQHVSGGIDAETSQLDVSAVAFLQFEHGKKIVAFPHLSAPVRDRDPQAHRIGKIELTVVEFHVDRPEGREVAGQPAYGDAAEGLAAEIAADYFIVRSVQALLVYERVDRTVPVDRE